MERGRIKIGKIRYVSFFVIQDYFIWFKFIYLLCYSYDECNLFLDIVSYNCYIWNNLYV